MTKKKYKTGPKPFWLGSTRIDEKRVKEIFKDPTNHSFHSIAADMLSNVNDSEEVFRYMSKEIFCRNWPAIKTELKKDAWFAHRAWFWQRIYDQTLSELKAAGVKIRRMPDINITPQRLKLANDIRNMRKRFGYTQEMVARIVGVKRSFIADVEAGKVDVSVDMLYKIAGACLGDVKIEFIDFNQRRGHGQSSS